MSFTNSRSKCKPFSGSFRPHEEWIHTQMRVIPIILMYVVSTLRLQSTTALHLLLIFSVVTHLISCNWPNISSLLSQFLSHTRTATTLYNLNNASTLLVLTASRNGPEIRRNLHSSLDMSLSFPNEAVKLFHLFSYFNVLSSSKFLTTHHLLWYTCPLNAVHCLSSYCLAVSKQNGVRNTTSMSHVKVTSLLILPLFYNTTRW